MPSLVQGFLGGEIKSCREIKYKLTLEQREFELHRSTYMWIFFDSKYYTATQSVVGCILGCGGTSERECCL